MYVRIAYEGAAFLGWILLVLVALLGVNYPPTVFWGL